MSARYFFDGPLPKGALRAVNLGKAYTRKFAWVHDLSSTLEEDQFDEPAAFEEAGEAERPATDRAWALRNIEFSIAPGERLAIVGEAGAGKSTLLKILAGMLAPSEGFVEGAGAAILLSCVQTPLIPRRSGYENLLMLGQMLRIPADRIERNIDRIIEFSGMGARVYQSAGRYSPALFQRLGISMALNVDPDILLVDEAIGVRDLNFAGKVVRRIGEVADAGSSLIFSSGSGKYVRDLCTRGLVLRSGTVAFDGDVAASLELLTASGMPLDDGTAK